MFDNMLIVFLEILGFLVKCPLKVVSPLHGNILHSPHNVAFHRRRPSLAASNKRQISDTVTLTIATATGQSVLEFADDVALVGRLTGEPSLALDSQYGPQVPGPLERAGATNSGDLSREGRSVRNKGVYKKCFSREKRPTRPPQSPGITQFQLLDLYGHISK